MIKSFQLGGKKYKVIEVDHDSGDLGKCHAPLGRIEVQKKWQGRVVPTDSKDQTVIHEMVHCLFYDIGRGDLANDETLVQSVALAFHQFMTTAETK
jgi:hypothetical protein